MNRNRRNAAKPAKAMAGYAMSSAQLDGWLKQRAEREAGLRPVATSLLMLDGFVTAIVAGPVSLPPPEWICPLLGVEPDAFSHDNEEFAAIAATAMHHNAIGEVLSTHPENFEPLFEQQANGDVDIRPWCTGFSAAVAPRLVLWSPLLQDSIGRAMLAPILDHCFDEPGEPALAISAGNSIKSTSLADVSRDIVKAVKALREYWMPTRFHRKA